MHAGDEGEEEAFLRRGVVERSQGAWARLHPVQRLLRG